MALFTWRLHVTATTIMTLKVDKYQDCNQSAYSAVTFCHMNIHAMFQPFNKPCSKKGERSTTRWFNFLPLSSHSDNGSNFRIYQPWWRHQMETFSALLAFCAGNSPVTGEFPSQRPATRGFDVFFDLRLNKRLSKQSRRRGFLVEGYTYRLPATYLNSHYLGGVTESRNTAKYKHCD